MTYYFDHLVFIVRDQIDLFFHFFVKMGFKLSKRYEHNLGSSNHLIILGDSYLEILGWELGTVPKREEIANLSIGIDALVFRTNSADECYEDLMKRGFSPNPVQGLSRPSIVKDKVVKATFKTVRFLTQPVFGLRIYFCEHCTPEYVWTNQEKIHPNQIQILECINVHSPNPKLTAESLSNLLKIKLEKLGTHFSISLPNCKINIYSDDLKDKPYISSCILHGNSELNKIFLKQEHFQTVLEGKHLS